MADSKSGPVKPPVLDLTARDIADPARDSQPILAEPIPAGTETGREPHDEPRPEVEPAAAAPEPPRPAAGAKAGGLAFGTMLAGAILGVAGAYGLAYVGYWPGSNAAAADPRLAQYGAALPELRTQIDTASGELATLTQRVKTLEINSAPATMGAAPELTALEADVVGLKAALAKVVPAQQAADLAGITGEIAALRSSLAELGARIGTAEAGIGRLGTSVAATSATLAAQPGDIGAVLQLPLVLSGLEAAFANGRPYAIELAALHAGLPDAAVPAAITNAAQTGLVRGDLIAQRFAQLLPDILNGRPAAPDAGWQDSVGGWFRSLVALRPTSAVAGDDPEAVVSRLEAAIARRDFIEAEALLAKLPAPMAAAAAELPGAIAAQASAAQLLQMLRDTALRGAGK